MWFRSKAAPFNVLTTKTIKHWTSVQNSFIQRNTNGRFMGTGEQHTMSECEEWYAGRPQVTVCVMCKVHGIWRGHQACRSWCGWSSHIFTSPTMRLQWININKTWITAGESTQNTFRSAYTGADRCIIHLSLRYTITLYTGQALVAVLARRGELR